MPASEDRIRRAVEDYVRLVASGTADEIVALYADDPVVEDPVGSPARRGREAVRDFYGPLEALDNETRLLAVRVTGGQAAFHFEVVTRTDGATYTLSPFDVMTFDDDGRITTMRAFWGEADMVVS